MAAPANSQLPRRIIKVICKLHACSTAIYAPSTQPLGAHHLPCYCPHRRREKEIARTNTKPPLSLLSAVTKGDAAAHAGARCGERRPFNLRLSRAAATLTPRSDRADQSWRCAPSRP